MYAGGAMRNWSAPHHPAPFPSTPVLLCLKTIPLNRDQRKINTGHRRTAPNDSGLLAGSYPVTQTGNRWISYGIQRFSLCGFMAWEGVFSHPKTHVYVPPHKRVDRSSFASRKICQNSDALRYRRWRMGRDAGRQPLDFMQNPAVFLYVVSWIWTAGNSFCPAVRENDKKVLFINSFKCYNQMRIGKRG